MSLTLDGTAQAQSVAKHRGVAWLVEMDFTTGTLRYTNAPLDFPIGGNVYTGFANLVGVTPVKQSEVTSTDRMTLSYTVVNQAMLAAALGNIDAYRGKAVRLYLQFFDADFQPAGAPVPRWFGYMDRVQVNRQRSSSEGGSSGGKIEMICSRAGMSRARHYEGLRVTHAQHIKTYPADKGFEYIMKLIEQPTRWLSKRFQEV